MDEEVTEQEEQQKERGEIHQQQVLETKQREKFTNKGDGEESRLSQDTWGGQDGYRSKLFASFVAYDQFWNALIEISINKGFLLLKGFISSAP